MLSFQRHIEKPTSIYACQDEHGGPASMELPRQVASDTMAAVQGAGGAGSRAEPVAGGHQARQRPGAPPLQLHPHGATALQTREPLPFKPWKFGAAACLSSQGAFDLNVLIHLLTDGPGSC